MIALLGALALKLLPL
ncbi:hypothetical protein VCHC69A1_0232A, partial [Vibrio cholerae HC-69A1]